MSDESDLVAYLTSKGVHVSRATGQEITVHCWACGDGDAKGKGKLYLNTESWLFQCKRCLYQGNRKVLLEHFGDEDTLSYGTFDPLKRRRILAEAADLAHDMLVANGTALNYLIDRGLSPELIVTHKLGYVPKNVGLSDMLPSRADLTIADLLDAKLISATGQEWFNESFTIPYFSHGTIIQIREKRRDGKYKTPPGDAVHLYNADALWGADKVLVTEGEFDALSVLTALEDSGDRELQAMAVVGLPGAGSWPQGLVETLGAASKVFIGLDPDDTGQKAAAKLKAELGAKARIVELPGGEPKTDWNDYFLPRTPRRPGGGHTWHDLRDLLIESDLAGKRMFTITDMRAKWLKRAVETPGLELGWTSLDAVIRPGLKPGQLLIPLAKTGCIQGEAELVVNRGGAAKRMTLTDLVYKFNGGASGRGKNVWRPDVPTRVQREVDGQVRLATVKAAWASGVKQTYTVTTEAGRQIRATDEHPFLTERGWVRLDELRVGDFVHVRGGRSAKGRTKKTYAQRTGLFSHPYSQRRDKPAGQCGGRVPFHRLVAEAELNNLVVEDFVGLVRAGRIGGLTFLDPEVHPVHHVDHDHRNNDPDNLRVMTHEAHQRLHAEEGTTSNVQLLIDHEAVVSVEPYGMEETYDIEVEDDPHNFIANGFVVHNTGKSAWLSNIIHNTRSHRVLYCSLELTAAEVYEHLYRIHKFWNPRAAAVDALADYPNLRITEMNRIGRGDLSVLVEEYRDEMGDSPEVLVVDYLQYYSRGFRGAAYERVSDAAMELKAVAKEEELALIVPSQVNRAVEHGKPITTDDARDSGVVEETGDFVVGMFRPDQVQLREGSGEMPELTGAWNMSLLKSRHGGKGRLFNMRFSNMSLAIVDHVFNPAAGARVDQENSAVRQGIHYETYREMLDERVAQGVLM